MLRPVDRPRPHGAQQAGRTPRPERESETWIREGEEAKPRPAAGGGRDSRRRPRSLPPGVARELAGTRGRVAGTRLERRLGEAVRAYESDRYREAAGILRSLVGSAPDSPSIRELYGLTLYRQGKWREAIRQLDRHFELTGSFDQYPVLADCHRALGHDHRAMELWEELRQASPSGELVAEGRMVVAGMMADSGDVKGAISLMRRARLDVRHPRDHHLRQTYVLADLYERAGDIPRARELFRRLMERDPDLTDASERLAALG